jgi:hypothetical protein
MSSYSPGQSRRIVLAAEGVAHEQAELSAVNEQIAALRAQRLAIKERLRDKAAALNESIVAAQSGQEPLPSLFEDFGNSRRSKARPMTVGAFADA